MRIPIYSSFLYIVAIHALSGCASGSHADKNTADHSISEMINIPIDEHGVIDSTKLAQIHFPDTAFNFDTIMEGAEMVHVFPFTNMGNIPLVINNVTTSCGCTIPYWSRQPIEPGLPGEITVRFRTNGWTGQQAKTAHVFANTIPAVTKIYLEGYVQPDN